jgi:dipeptidase E
MRALLGSGGVRTDERRALYVQEMRRHFGDVSQVLFVPWALDDHDRYLELMRERGLDAGYELVGIHTQDNPLAALESAEAISIGGGNTFRLTWELQRSGALEVIRRRVVEDGIPYMGVSAGTNVACPTMQTTNDMPIVQPSSFATLHLVPFQVNAHYFSGSTWARTGEDEFLEHFGETRDDRIREFHEMNDLPVIGLREGSYLRCHDSEVTLIGAQARLFRSGHEPIEVSPDENISSHLYH